MRKMLATLVATLALVFGATLAAAPAQAVTATQVCNYRSSHTRQVAIHAYKSNGTTAILLEGYCAYDVRAVASGTGTTLKVWPRGGSVVHLGPGGTWYYFPLRQAYYADGWRTN